jgi:hypothetical protein
MNSLLDVGAEMNQRSLSLVAHLSPRAAAYLEWCQEPLRRAYRDAMNRQRGRQEIVRRIFCVLNPAAVIETGTYRGATTEFLSHLTSAPVYSVELKRRYFEYAKMRFAEIGGVTLELGDSRSFLRKLSADARVPKQRVFFYLDAHWETDVPLREELLTIAEHWSESVIMIDDFQVADDEGYGFDDYGPGKRLTLEYLPLEHLDAFCCLVPELPSAEETGFRRGCLVLAPREMDQELSRSARLRSASSRPVPVLR